MERIIREQAKKIKELEREVKHWRSNHDQRAEACRVLKQRRDMPVERTHAYQTMLDLQAKLNAIDKRLEFRNNPKVLTS